ncbi:MULTISPECIES: rhodanese-like domain-containing protein [Pseudidiomarina]|uniref:Rhodanese-related sulfurtransferase n=3 Tax=Pseudidiomarina TaxID=2800384 RepID=A0A368US55_9GAMM|nr:MULTISPECIES: rhodanese-like domain-containing protein [Pseudidiomarina]MDX1526435.1 rhodanese-like domain-containing protein [Pseudidiomarina maritima]PWW11902.1 rhodanese-related sulfurtransferase [Pseudidiomarina maritima]RBP88969.1 rhodanese-related sulfurtransferase [Pseudidiomarina tainanensis]RCW30955.1 rhodanese-related sulfurtransferase [Pseudidiomarina tainanensis]
MINSQDLCAQARANVKEIDVHTLQQKIAEGARVIDVREPAEYAVGHIRQAVNMPRGVLEMQINQHPAVAGYDDALQRIAAEPLYLICRSGGRSALAAESLLRMGFDADKVISVAGGMNAWEEAKYPQVAGE